MKQYLTFETFWMDYQKRSIHERRDFFDSLSKTQRSQLVCSFFDDGWAQLVVQNVIDKRLDYIKRLYDIDLIELRIQAIKLGKVFLINKRTWEEIEDLMLEFEDYYDINILFGDLVVKEWGRQRQFCKIRATRRF